ncbi:MAG TPA: alpha/beta hydrolase [Burkholderiales bacterium]|nr:alpha/beta hydrolase [Burkholderiales bacterium]
MIKDAAYYESMFNNRAAVPEFQSHFDSWAARSEQARKDLDVELDVPYGDDRMETMDIFRPRGEATCLLMFIHGGYWRSLDKKQHSFVATPFVNAGAAVAAINYSLCPAVRIEDIVLQCLKAGAWLYRNAGEVGAPRNRIFVAGHSAGGHLTAMCMAAQWPRYSRGLPEKVMQAGFCLSGIYDLRPVALTPSINVDLRLTEAGAVKLSPGLMPPATRAPVFMAVGGRELGGFKEQHALLAAQWAGVLAEDIPAPDDDHFTILNSFADPQSAVGRGALRMMGLAT